MAAGTWTVTRNLTAKGNCITIKANGVSIDLHGYTITGNGTGAGIIDGAATCPPTCPAPPRPQNIIIGNGTIKGFQYGIHLTLTYYPTIASMNVVENVEGIVVAAGSAAVTDSQANNNENYGMYFGGSGTVYNSQANSNGINGMYFIGVGTVNNSQANSNGDYGMYFGDAGVPGLSSNTVSNSQANNNSMAGTFAGMFFAGPQIGTGTVTISNSQANNTKAKTGKGDDGILAGPSSFLTGTTANGNGNVGISVPCPSDLFDNTASGNPGGNIVTSNPTPPLPAPACARLGNNPAP